MNQEQEKAMPEQTLLIDGVRVPRFLYGTAWKEDQTQCLTELALQPGFRGIYTANQRRHYHEAAVGRAVAAAVASGLVAREELFLQTKFTFRQGQDDRLPYDPQAPISTQVEQSFASSLVHLGVSVIDSYLLHGPSQQVGLGPADWEAWRAMEAIHNSGRARLLGVSNVNLDQLRRLCQGARVRRRFVQNRC
jgi:diketogulonate reductase-like aldo/keto reductase